MIIKASELKAAVEVAAGLQRKPLGKGYYYENQHPYGVEYSLDMSKADPDDVVKFIEDLKAQHKGLLFIMQEGPHGIDERNIELAALRPQSADVAEDEDWEPVDNDWIKQLKAIAKREKNR